MVLFLGQDSITIKYADMAELADALDSGSSRGNSVQVQFLLSAPNSTNPNLFLVGDGFGFVVYYEYPNFNSKSFSIISNHISNLYI